MILMTHVPYRAPVPGSWVVGTKGRGFLMALCVGEGRGEVGHEACHKPKMGSPENFFWEGLECASCQPKEMGGAAVQSKRVPSWLWVSIRWPSVVVQPRRTRDCSLLSICACQAPAKTTPRRNLHWCSLLPDKEGEMTKKWYKDLSYGR